ncbi:MAG: tetratricopeptide repeat protein [Balneola sp.]
MKKYSPLIKYVLGINKAIRLIVLGLIFFVALMQSGYAQEKQDEIEYLATKAEDFYPANMDSSIYYTEFLYSLIKSEGLNSPFEEQMLDLQGRIYRRLGEPEKSEDFFKQSIALSDQRGNTTQLGDSYNRIGLLYRGTGRYEEALESYQKSIAYKEEDGNILGAAGTLNNLGSLYRIMGEKDKAYESYLKSIEIKEELGDELSVGGAYLNLGNWLSEEAEYDNAMIYYQKFSDLMKSVEDTVGLSMVISNMGNIYFSQGAYASALENYLESLSLLQQAEINDNRLMASKLEDIGLVYDKQGYSREAISYFNRALLVYEKYEDPERKGGILQNIGILYESLNLPDSALHFYDLAISEYDALNNKELGAFVHNNIGVIYNTQKEYNTALQYFEKALAVYEKSSNERELAEVYLNLGSNYYFRSDFDQALSFFQKSLENALRTDNLSVETKALSAISDVYKIKNDFPKAYEYLDRHNTMKDSLLNSEKTKVIEELITKYETEKKDAEIKVLSAEQAQNEALIQQRNAENKLLVIGLLALLGAIIGIVSWFVYHTRKKRIIASQKEDIYQKEIDSLLDNQQLKTIGAMLEGQEKERKRLASELHDRLGSILSLVKLYFSSLNEDLKDKQPELYNHFEEGNRFLDDAFLEVRAIIKEMHEGKISGDGLKNDVNELLSKIAKIGVDVQSNINLSMDLETHVEINVFRIIQEALSNALKYSKANVIELLLSDGETLTLKIKDNGIGFDPNQAKTSETDREGYGVGNMENRVKLLDGKFQLQTAKGQGVDIDIQIPLN